MEDEEERDTYAFVGTPLDPYEQDEALKKPVPIQDQIATDDRGRRRFHGAFTGGFSAGYFNTVGTEEGWTPTEFKSSREQRNDVLQKPEDFMDEEDFGEHGIAPRQVSTTEKFTPADVSRKRKVPSVLDTNTIPGESPLQGLVKAAKVSMGTRLLRKLGWKEGQGVGPRVKKKKVKRFYGCALPPELQPAKEEGGSDEASSEEEEDLHPDDVTFAPKDVNPIDFKPKDNVQGIGYSGLNAQTELGHVNLFEPPPVRSKGRKGFTGQAFGVGAFEDEDDDIYALDHLSNYNRELITEEDGAPEKGKATPRKRKSRWDATAAIEKALEGFHLTSKAEPPKQTYPPPDIPKDFKPKHVFKSSTSAPQKSSDPNERMDASKRSALLGEGRDIKSVFDLITDKDKEKMDNAKNPHPPDDPPTSSSPPPEKKTPSDSFLNTTTFQDFLRPGASSSGFRPFAKDPAKQTRYEAFLAARKQGNDAPNLHEGTDLTEWDKSREREEFEGAASLYRPLSSLMASRFTTAKMKHDDDRTVELNAETGGEQVEQHRAAAMKMFGKLTRDRFEWHPDKVLCKRFNIANPYPDSTIVGLPKVKRDKFSVFNFLGFPGTAEERAAETPRPKTPDEIVEDTPKSNLKPLAILGSMDLRPKTQPKPLGNVNDDEGQDEDEEDEDREEEEEEDTLDDRPSMDLFKAIFENSEDEQEKPEEEEMDTTEPPPQEEAAPPLPPPSLEEVKEEVKSPQQPETTQVLCDRLGTPEESAERNAGTLTDLINSVLSSTDSNSDSSDSDMKLPEKKKIKKKKSKKSKKKKAKAKKSKHKKHKSKKKKKKKLKEVDTDSEKESSDSEDDALNQVLAQRLSTLSQGDRKKLLKR